MSHLPEGNYPDRQQMIVADGKILCATNSDRVIFSDRELMPLQLPEHEHLMGLYDGTPCYVSALDTVPELPEQWCWRSLWSLLGKLSDDHFAWVGRASQLVNSYHNHRFCGRCGEATQWMAKEHASRCESCQLEFYPRLSPCAIMVVTRGDECLLARNVDWEQWFSALAGFIEPGESVEQAVRREVLEEVGIEVGDVHYVGSQPWPFPGQLMLGFLAEYKSGEILLAEDEIAEAGWWRYDQLPPHPDTRALSGRLIQYFVDQQQASR